MNSNELKRIGQLRGSLRAIANSLDDHELRAHAREALQDDDRLSLQGSREAVAAAAGDPVKPGHVKLVRLAREGRIAAGDLVETSTLGVCEIVSVEAVDGLTVQAADGARHSLIGIDFGGNARLSTNGTGSVAPVDADESHEHIHNAERPR